MNNMFSLKIVVKFKMKDVVVVLDNIGRETCRIELYSRSVHETQLERDPVSLEGEDRKFSKRSLGCSKSCYAINGIIRLSIQDFSAERRLQIAAQGNPL